MAPLYNPQDIMPDKMMDRDPMRKTGTKTGIIIAVILLIVAAGVIFWLKKTTEDGYMGYYTEAAESTEITQQSETAKNKEHYLLSIPGLSYGMTEEEIIGVLGEPSSRKVNDGMAILTYTENIDSCFIHDDTEYGVLLYMDGDDPKESRLMNLNINVISTWKDVEADMLEYYGPYTKNEYNYSTTVGFGREDAVPWISYYGYEELLGEEKVTITLTTLGAEETVPEKYKVIVGISLLDQLYQY